MNIREEGENCYRECGGKLEFKEVENCSCHINPPCKACVDNDLTCDQCGWSIDDEESVAHKASAE